MVFWSYLVCPLAEAQALQDELSNGGAGTSGGGVYQTTNGGLLWQPTSPF
jgi:hypothetical protein